MLRGQRAGQHGDLPAGHTPGRHGVRHPAGGSSTGDPGPPLALAALALGDNDAISDGRLSVEGDTGLAHQFQQALARLDPDWEAALARYTGDIPAHFIGQRIRSAVRWSRQAMASVTASLEEYIHEETGALPGKRELEPTFEEIDQLSLRSERLSARVERLESRVSPGSGQSGTEKP